MWRGGVCCIKWGEVVRWCWDCEYSFWIAKAERGRDAKEEVPRPRVAVA